MDYSKEKSDGDSTETPWKIGRNIEGLVEEGGYTEAILGRRRSCCWEYVGCAVEAAAVARRCSGD
jgi:hypothetical protein